MQLTLFLKRVLLLDAASCLGMGALLAPIAGPLSPLFGLENSLLFGAGVALIPTGLFILWVGTRTQIRPLLVYLVIAGNFVWVLESLLLVRGAAEITGLGTAFVVAQAAAVAGLALFEWIGVRRARQTATPA
jgi:hypothetical protein